MISIDSLKEMILEDIKENPEKHLEEYVELYLQLNQLEARYKSLEEISGRLQEQNHELTLENEKLEQYKASKQVSYEALQKKCNELELENRELKEYQKLLEEQMKFNQSELELSLSSEINRSEFLLKEFKRVDKQKDNWREKAEGYRQTLIEIKEIAKRDKEFCIKCNGDKEIDCIECIEGGRALLAKEILQKISEVIKDE